VEKESVALDLNREDGSKEFLLLVSLILSFTLWEKEPILGALQPKTDISLKVVTIGCNFPYLFYLS